MTLVYVDEGNSTGIPWENDFDILLFTLHIQCPPKDEN
jgi:hypothetical protein